jgi:hypothetical protein
MTKNLRINGFDSANFHDSILEEVTVSWGKNATVTFLMTPNEAFINPSRPIKLIGKRLKHLVCPNENPWGQSNFVNNVRLVNKTEAEQTEIEIEMQSGDVILVIAETFEVKSDELKAHVNSKDD